MVLDPIPPKLEKLAVTLEYGGDTLFAFCNRQRTSIKLLIFDGNGFWLCQKRFSNGKLKWWPQDEAQAAKLRAVELLIILQQGHPEPAHIPEHWRQLPNQVS